MTSGRRATGIECRGGHVSATWRHAIDDPIEVSLHRMTVLDLRRLQTTLLAELSDAPGTKDVVRQQKEAPARDDAPSVIVLLAAVAVALAWWTYRGKAAPAPNIRRVFDCVTDGHSYLLPIPRSQPCFCGDGIQFKDCHGRPPNAAPFTGGNLTVVRASSG